MNSTQQKLVEDNMNLVFYIIYHDYPTYRFDEDIQQSAMLGLCSAAENFDPEKGEFQHFAARCIRNEIYHEFLRRKPFANTISLETKIGEDDVLGDVLVGEDDVAFFDERFYSILTDEELDVLRLDRLGFETDEIVKQTGYADQKVQKLLRIIRIKWRNFNERSC